MFDLPVGLDADWIDTCSRMLIINKQLLIYLKKIKTFAVQSDVNFVELRKLRLYSTPT